jgi:dTDP-4-dehydrorhamnose reductase
MSSTPSNRHYTVGDKFMARIALIGANGQLGTDITRLWANSPLGKRDDELIGLTHADIEVTDPDMVRSVLSGVQPSIVINTAAYHDIDQCEANPLEAFQVNALGVKHVAEACLKLGATLVHFSNDCVFDGKKGKPYVEDDAPAPVSAYGISEVGGERFLRYILPDDHLLVRSAGLYGVAGASGKGGNFVETMLRLARDGGPIRVVDDQIASPTYTLDLAQVLLDVIAQDVRGTLHITNAGECSWYEFASEVFDVLGLRPDFAAITTAEAHDAGQRPRYSVLSNARLESLGFAQPRHWRQALTDYLKLKGRLAA